MSNRTTREIREVFYLNWEATKTLHTLIPDYKEYRICKVYLEIPVLYIDIPDFCPTYVKLTNEEKNKRPLFKRLFGSKMDDYHVLYSVTDMGKYKRIHFSDNVLCICKNDGGYEIPNREKIDEFKSKFTSQKDWSVEIEVGKKSNDSYSKYVNILIKSGVMHQFDEEGQDYHDCKIRLYVALEKYTISPDLDYELDKDGEYAILTLDLPESILCTDTQEGKCYYRLDRLTKKSRMKFEEFKSKAIIKREIIESQRLRHSRMKTVGL